MTSRVFKLHCECCSANVACWYLVVAVRFLCPRKHQELSAGACNPQFKGCDMLLSYWRRLALCLVVMVNLSFENAVPMHLQSMCIGAPIFEKAVPMHLLWWSKIEGQALSSACSVHVHVFERDRFGSVSTL